MKSKYRPAPALELLEERTLPAPVLAALPPRSLEEGDLLAVAVRATSAGPNLRYSLDPGAPAGAMIDASSGLLTWTPPSVQATYTIPIRASDDTGSAATTLTVMVFDVPPTVQAGGNLVLAQGAALARSGYFTDPNPDAWTATVDYGDGTGVRPLALTPEKTFTLDHVYTTPGGYTASVIVTDSQGGTGYGYFAALVNPTAVPGVDYLLSGTRWPSRTITYSFAPDGTPWGTAASNLFARFDATLGANRWEAEFARALETWGAAAGLTFLRVPDSGAPLGAPGLDQGDPRYGDIRIGGHALADSRTLAFTYLPWAGSTLGGDLTVNTAQPYQIGNGPGFDLYSVALHETGLALGLAEVTNPAAVMQPQYHGVLAGLAPGDLVGIRTLYALPAVASPVAVAPLPVAFPSPTPTPTPTPPTTTPVVTAPTRFVWVKVHGHWLRRLARVKHPKVPHS